MNLIKKIALYFVIVFTIINCGDTEKKQRNNYDYSLELMEEVTLKGALLSGANRIVKFDEQYYILDTQNKKIYTYTEDGELINEFGNYGKGPGEFINPVSLAMDENGLIYVFDISQQRLSVFKRGGKLDRTVNVKGRGFQMVVSGDKFYLYNSFVFSSGKPMVPVFNTNNGKEVAELSPASTLVGKIGGGMSGASIMGLAVADNKLIVLQHPMQLRVRLYDLGTQELLNKIDLDSNYFNKPEIPDGYAYGQDKPSDVTNAFVTGFYANNEKIYVLYTEFGTGDKYLDVFTLGGKLMNKEPVKLEKKFPRYLDDEGLFYSFAWTDSADVSEENSIVSLRKYRLNETSISE